MTGDLPLSLLAVCPRMLGLAVSAPGFSAAFVPPQVRVAMAVALAVVLAPLIPPPRLDAASFTAGTFLALLVTELLLGLVMGFMATALLEMARLAGEIVDLQIGIRAGSLYDPASGSASTELGRLWFLAALIFFFQLNGHHWLVAGLARSYSLCPVGTLVYQPQVTVVAVELLAAQFSLAIRLAAPAIAALILADLALGLAGRGMPQMNLLMVGMPAKILVGLGALALCSPTLAPVMGQVLEVLERQLTRLLQALA